MTQFLATALTFPTLVYSILLAFCVVYWLIAATGAIDTDAIDGLLATDGDSSEPSTAAGMLAKLGLSGVPLMLVLTVLAFTGWVLTYFVHLLLLRHLPDALRLIAGVGTVVVALLPGIVITSLLLRPVAKLVNRLRPPEPPTLLGRTGTVISPYVDAQNGRAEIADGGAGLILQVRAQPGLRLSRGDRVVLIEHAPADNSYVVIAESTFNQL
jgi:hypothetical protein